MLEETFRGFQKGKTLEDWTIGSEVTDFEVNTFGMTNNYIRNFFMKREISKIFLLKMSRCERVNRDGPSFQKGGGHV